MLLLRYGNKTFESGHIWFKYTNSLSFYYLNFPVFYTSKSKLLEFIGKANGHRIHIKLEKFNEFI